MMRASTILLLACLGCGDDGGGDVYTVVTVQNRPAVHDVATLRVTLGNSGTMRTDDIPVGTATLPATFSLTATGRTGDLTISVDALDAAGLLVGRGTTSATVDAPTATVMLETTDFVVNTEYAEDQFPSAYYDTHGYAVGATSDGSFAVTYRATCPTAGCNVFARRFDSAGRPKMTQVAAGTAGFPVSTKLSDSITSPAVAGAAATNVFVWNYDDPASTTIEGVACRALDAQGRAMPDQALLSPDTATDNATIAPLSNNNFIVSWVGSVGVNTPRVVRGQIVRPDCALVGATVTVSTTTGPFSPAVTANGNTILYGWENDGNAYVRLASLTNVLQGAADVLFLPKTANEQIDFVRVAPLGTGFAVLVRWSLVGQFMGAGKIEMYRTSATGGVLGQAVLVSTRSGSDSASSESFGVATRNDGTLMVTWSSCESNGDGQGCGVFARAFRSDGTPLGEELVVPTTIRGEQTDPSVAALGDAFVVVWKDESMQAPDISGTAVRARIVYPTASGTN